MHNKYKDKGFVLISAHRQNPNLKDKCIALLRQHKANYTVTDGGSVVGDTSRGIPHAYLFDWNGQLVKGGRPSALYQEVDALMGRAPHWLTAARRFKDGAVKKAVAKLGKNKGYGKIIKSLEKISGAGAEEANFLKDRILSYGNSKLSQAETDVTNDPLAAQIGLRTLKKLFKGHEIGNKAKARLKELKQDKDFQKELKAFRFISQMEALSSNLRPQYKPDHPVNKNTILQIKGLARKLMKKYPKTKAAARAREIVENLPG